MGEGADLLRGQVPELARVQPAQGEGTDGDAPQLRHRMADRLHQAADLVVLPLVQGQLQPGVVLGLEQADAVRGQPLPFHAHARGQPRQRLLAGDVAHLGLVHPRHLVARVGDALGEVAVVGEDDEALGADVEAADREQPGHRGHQAHHGGTALRIVARRDHAPRLVEEEVDRLRGGSDAHAVHADVVGGDVRLRSQLADGLAVHGDAAVGHHLLGRAPRRDARPGQDLLDALLHVASLS